MLSKNKNIRECVVKALEKVLSDTDFTASNSLVEDGILDSFSTVMLISELSTELGVEFNIKDLTPENLNTIDSIVNTIESLLNTKLEDA